MHNPNAFTLPERFWAKAVAHPSGCLIWQGALSNQGYGQFVHDGRTQSAHRLAYMAEKGPIPDGLQIDHLCCVRACVNPEHLEAVTASENNRRRVVNNGPVARITHQIVDRWGHQEVTHVAYGFMRWRCSICRSKTRA